MSILTGSNLSTQVAEALKQGRTAIGVSLLKGLNISFFHTHHPRTHMDFKYYEHSEWIAFRTKMQAIAKDVNRLESKQSMLLTKISNLEFAQDLVMRKKWDLESVTKKTTKVLTEITGDCDECWFWKYDSAEDEIKDLRISKCLEIASIQSEINLLKHDREVLDKEQDACRDRLIKEHNDATKDQGLATASTN